MSFSRFAGGFLFVLFFLSAVATPSVAQEESFASAPWRFHVNLYGWLPDAPAQISVDGEEVVDVPEDLDTILDSLEAAAMFELELHKGRFVLFANNVYYKGDYDKNFKGPVTGLSREYELEEEVWAVKYGAGYRLGTWDMEEGDDPRTVSLYPWVGAFMFHDDWSLKIKPTDVPFGGKVSGTYEFNTPMVGLTSRMDLSENWYLNLSYGYGGWGVDDVDEIYDFVGNFAYRFEMGGVSSKLLAGYRYLYFDQQSQGTQVKLTAKGPFFGIGWEF